MVYRICTEISLKKNIQERQQKDYQLIPKYMNFKLRFRSNVEPNFLNAGPINICLIQWSWNNDLEAIEIPGTNALEVLVVLSTATPIAWKRYFS